MKTTKSICLLILFVLSAVCNAQNKKFGVKGGFNISSIIVDKVILFDDVKSINGFQFLASYDVYNNNFITVSTEVGYIMKGYENNIVATNQLGEVTGSTRVKNKMNYLDFTVNLKFIYRSEVSPFLSIAPAGGIYLGGSSISSGSNASNELNSLFKLLLDSMEKFSFGFKFGAGAEFNNLIKKVPLVLEARYYPDLTKSYNKESFKYKNKCIEFNLGVKF